VQHGDDLQLLAAHALRDLYQLTEADDAVCDVASNVASDARLHAYLLRVETAALLEFGMACSPCNYHFKILAMEVSASVSYYQH
jgi:hypothetical protein